MKLFIVLFAGTLPCLCLAVEKGDLKAGTAVFATSCKTCHGAQGEGNPAIAKVLKTEIQNLGSKEVQDLTDEQLKSIVTDGKGKMKPVKTVSGTQLDDVVTFIRSLAKP